MLGCCRFRGGAMVWGGGGGGGGGGELCAQGSGFPLGQRWFGWHVGGGDRFSQKVGSQWWRYDLKKGVVARCPSVSRVGAVGWV